MIELNKNQLVLFENGHKAERAEVCWSNKHNAFALVTDETDDDGNRIIYYSTTIVEKAKRAKKPFVPTKDNCQIEIYPVFETEKAYAICDGHNGYITKAKEYYRYIAKSICYVDTDGKIYAPVFATKYLDR